MNLPLLVNVGHRERFVIFEHSWDVNVDSQLDNSCE